MKTILSVLFICFVFFMNIEAQTEDNNLKSVVFPPAGYTPHPSDPMSAVVTINGFDNFYLGVDFGEPYIAINPRDPLNCICAYNTNSLYYTLNGHDWTRAVTSFTGFPVIGDPVMTYDSLGTAYYTQLYQNGATYGIATLRSTDKGVTWFGAANCYSTTVGLADKEWNIADQTAGPYSNFVYISWRQFGSSGMRFIRSTDRGVNWSAPLTFGGSQGAYVTVGANGNIQGGSVYMGCIANGSELVARSTDGGVTFGNQVTVTTTQGPGVLCDGRNTVKTCIRTDPFPRMAADNSFTATRGNVYVVFADNVIGPDNADIFLCRSTDYGATWSARIRVNDDNTTTDQWEPSVSVDNSNGKIFICWFDSRIDPVNNVLTKLYGTYSTDGGLTFTPNDRISDVAFNPDNMRVSQGGHNYIGDYIGIAASKNTSYSAWMDARNNNLGSYVGFYPDYAMTINPTLRNMGNNDSAVITVKVPALKGPYTDRVKFTAALDTLPQSGTISLTFQNGRDSLIAYPDSVYLKVRTIGSVTPRSYTLTITGKGSNGIPVHKRNVQLLVNSSLITVGTNRNGIADFKVNGIQYNTTQQLPFANSSVVTVQAISPKILNVYKYVYTNWSDAGDTTHNITVNGNITLTAFYKVQYKLLLSSSIEHSFGGNTFYDSAQSFTFGVTSKIVDTTGFRYRFRGWDGVGAGSYTSTDSTGNDTTVILSMNNPIAETPRWETIIGIKNLGSEIPKEYKLYQNFPNPFNPSTTINFDIIKTGNVKIIIYDLLGRETAVLVNEMVKPGRFNITFDASGYASGVYYYKIISNDFTDIKKLVVLK